MTVIEEHENRLDQLDTDVGEIKGTVADMDIKLDVVVSSTDAIATNVGLLNTKAGVKKEIGEVGTIQKGDWKGTMASVIATAITVAMTAWSLWSIMYGNSQPFFAYLSIVCQPTIFLMIKTLTGNDIKKNELVHQLDIKTKEKTHKVELDKIQGIMQMKVVENFGLKERIARLETKQEIVKKEIHDIPLPPQ